MKAYIIHLDRARERLSQLERIRSTLEQSASAIKVEVITAVDAVDMSDVALKSYVSASFFSPRYPFSLRPSEAACFLSHRKCWEIIVASKGDGALVVEDDVSIDASNFMVALEAAVKAGGANSYVRFPVKAGRDKGQTVLTHGPFTVVEPIVPGLGAQCQYVGKDAAKVLLDASKRFDRPVDSFIQLRKAHQVRVLSVLPLVVSEISANIGGTHIHNKEKRPIERLLRIALRLKYRLSLWWLSRLG